MRKKKHIYFFDYLRAISAIGVVMYHYTTRYDEIYGHNDSILECQYGYMGVVTFFLLSGCLACIHLKDNEVPFKWLKNRIIRLFPIYWISMTLTFVLSRNFLPSRNVSFFEYILNFTMFNEILGAKSVDGAYWTLRYELTFYLIIFGILLFKKADRMKEIFVLWQVGIFLLDIVKQYIEIPNGLLNILLSQYIAVFVIGVVLGTIYKNKSMSFMDIVSIVIALVYFFLKNGFAYTIYLFAVLCLFVIILENDNIRKWELPRWGHKILIWVASISYPLYLVHQNIGYIIILKLEKLQIDSILAVIVSIVVAILFTIVLDALDKRILNPFFKKALGV